ncbi:hypothetical protein L1987_66381 [Smallanthus sonchifolius]|uniref:Uncharacterized protein n=1 Tax=Smallanthus sonchifolius TaxID=185202 RepID=A0ACB9BX43_9ASTR|nr:hypothetical protein L1987_66381 [Smallanthus sonchifolius]
MKEREINHFYVLQPIPSMLRENQRVEIRVSFLAPWIASSAVGSLPYILWLRDSSQVTRNLQKVPSVLAIYYIYDEMQKGRQRNKYPVQTLSLKLLLNLLQSRGKLYEYANNNIKSTIEKYKKATSSSQATLSTQEINAQFYQQESNKLRQQIQTLQNTNRHLMGQGLDSLNLKELKHLESRLDKGISRIRSKRHDMILAETEKLQKREIELEQHNAFLRSKIDKQIAESMQELNVNTAQEYNAWQAYLARNTLHLNIMEPMEDAPSAFSIYQKPSLHYGYTNLTT